MLTTLVHLVVGAYVAYKVPHVGKVFAKVEGVVMTVVAKVKSLMVKK